MSTGLLIFTLVHVAVSLVGIAAGFVWMAKLLRRSDSPFWTNLFLGATILTSVSGFGFPYNGVTPGIVIGILSLIILGVATYARVAEQQAGRWNATFIVTALVAQYFNVFVLVVQSFQKVAFLKALAPTQSEAPFALTQLAVLIGFVAVGILSLKRHRRPALAAS
ncbi:MAG TPA: hypothetical protein VM452_19285 [Caulifigura sp.]|jgi:hypothetical protein|nr:hypothetical protein [Caulifigura sp.]